MRDVILLTGPDINSVPRQAKRVWLVENGFVMSGASESVKEVNTQILLLAETNQLLILALELLSTLL